MTRVTSKGLAQPAMRGDSRNCLLMLATPNASTQARPKQSIRERRVAHTTAGATGIQDLPAYGALGTPHDGVITVLYYDPTPDEKIARIGFDEHRNLWLVFPNKTPCVRLSVK